MPWATLEHHIPASQIHKFEEKETLISGRDVNHTIFTPPTINIRPQHTKQRFAAQAVTN